MSTASDHGLSKDARICLDFGTAFSKASTYMGGQLRARDAARAIAIGAAAGAEHALLTPSVMFVDQGRIFLGPRALARARDAELGRDPLLSFKTVLAARDLNAALELKVQRALDPTGTLRHRDALVLYLAYLDQLIRAAIAADPAIPTQLGLELMNAPRRYTSPIWRARGDADAAMGRLFDEAAEVSQRLGAGLLDPAGVSIAQSKTALDHAARTIGIGQLERGVFEAHAAAAAYAAFATTPKAIVLVIDMGAGTTDIAAFEQTGAHGELKEIIGARQCCGLAGDEVDDMIVNLLMHKSGAGKPARQAALWRALRLSARELKRDLFDAGKCVFRAPKTKLVLRREELLNAPAFKEFARALIRTCAASARAAANRAAEVGATSGAILLAGGGAHLSFLHDAAASAAAEVRFPFEIERFGAGFHMPANYDEGMYGAFPQVAISLGGALAQLADTPATAPV